jgi:hypothetical protein
VGRRERNRDNEAMQQPPSAPPQWSADGLWWWDGTRWRSRSESMTPPAPPGYLPPSAGYWVPPQPAPLAPSPGLRIFLLVVLGVTTAVTGFFALLGVFGVTSGPTSGGDVALAAAFVLLLAVSVIALVGVSVRASWSRVAAIVAGVAVSFTCLGLVLGIPILVAAVRAPDLSRPRA